MYSCNYCRYGSTCKALRRGISWLGKAPAAGTRSSRLTTELLWTWPSRCALRSTARDCRPTTPTPSSATTPVNTTPFQYFGWQQNSTNMQSSKCLVFRHSVQWDAGGGRRRRCRHLANWTKQTCHLWFWLIPCTIWKHDVIHKTGVHYRQRRTKPRPCVTCTENLDVWVLRYASGETDKRTDIQKRWSHYFAPLLGDDSCLSDKDAILCSVFKSELHSELCSG